MLAVDPNHRNRGDRDQANCLSCGATTSNCRSVEWLRGRRCCEACDHTGGER
jgi:hypothetical protein